jgi:hypothetical protein
MKKLSKAEWQVRIIEVAQTLSKTVIPDDHSLMQLLVDIIVSEQSRLKPKNLAMLAAVAAALLERVKNAFPAATHITESGEPVFTEAQIAAHLGVSLEELHRAAAEMAEAFPDAGLVYTDVDPDSLHRVN